MRLELAVLAAVSTMACASYADNHVPQPDVQPEEPLLVHPVHAVPLNIHPKELPEAELLPSTEVAPEEDLSANDPCPPCGRG